MVDSSALPPLSSPSASQSLSVPSVYIPLRYAIFKTYQSHVTTVFSSGHESSAWRDITPENFKEARAQGYIGTDEEVVWQSLVEHELLHSLVSEIIFDRPSSVLGLTAGLFGDDHPPLYLRYEEEMICIAMQYRLNGKSNPACLHRYSQMHHINMIESRLLNFRSLFR